VKTAIFQGRLGLFNPVGLRPRTGRSFVFFLSAIFYLAHSTSAFACAACYGQSDSPMARGMTWGILALLAVVLSVLGCVTGFFVYIGRRSNVEKASAPDTQLATDPQQHE
jgi:hypothetical protein